MKIIAEIGSVHDGSFGNACKLIELAASCGAGVVKFQTHIAEAETLADAPMPPYFKGEPRLDYFRRTEFSENQWRELKRVCNANKVEFLSSPFSLEAVDVLEKVGVESYKIPSGEVTNIPLLEKVALTQKPIFLSSGMSSWEELDRAVSSLMRGGHLTILQCTSEYPCSAERVGLNVISEMKQRYGKEIGFSDHYEGFSAAFAAAALGATVFEKHLTFSRAMYGSDAANAMEPNDFKQYCSGVYEIGRMLESPVDKDDVSPFYEMKAIFEKSIVAAKTLSKGSIIHMDDLAFKKPGDGMSASKYHDILGKVLCRDVLVEHKFTEEDFLV
ncbi:MAG: N-acetylneuraminate synthase family protein [Rhodospirillales bacterium]|nr:N-acetylneuraminate synthase family protein [Rhodospirillales bacterium]